MTAIPDCKFTFTNLDQSEELLDQDVISQSKILGKIQDFNSGKQFDLILLRYVLHYNGLSSQRVILEKINKLLKDDGLFILHHCGSVNKEHQQKLNALFGSDVVSSKLARRDSYWSTWDEVETLLKEAGFNTNTLEHYTIPVGDLYKQRYDLNDQEEAKLHEFLGSQDFVDYVIASSRKTLKSF
jgi:SAM-dependent methyltransferase